MPSPTTSSITTSVRQSATLNIDALLSGTRWGGGTGTGVTITYSFPWSNGGTANFSGANGFGDYSQLNEHNSAFRYGLNATEQAAARNVLLAWSSVANITFSEVDESSSNVGDVRFAWTSEPNQNAWGWAYAPNAYWPSGGDVWLSSNSSGDADLDWAPNSYNFYALGHEVGHALGLKHSFEGNPVLLRGQDSWQFTIMSYTPSPKNLFVKLTSNSNGSVSLNSSQVVPDGPMLYDLAAIQYVYGPNFSYRTGNDVYTFDPATPFLRTIWDAGGVDTISVANFSKDCVIDLRQGHYSSITIESDSTSAYNWASPPTTATYDGTNNLAVAFGCVIENATGGWGNDILIGNSSNNFLNGGKGTDSAVFSANLSRYTLSKAGSSYTVRDNTGSDGTDTLTSIERLKFADKTVNLTIQAQAAAAPQADVNRLAELYVAFFNRVPDADGLSHWIGQLGAGQSVTQIAEAFYNAGIQYASLTGFSAGMTNADFVNVIYKNVLGRSEGADAGGLAYWSGELASGRSSHGSLVTTMLSSAHTFKGDATYGWVADLLDNKLTVAKTFAVDWGLNYNTPAESISQGMAIAAAVTPTGTTTAIALIGVTGSEFQLG